MEMYKTGNKSNDLNTHYSATTCGNGGLGKHAEISGKVPSDPTALSSMIPSKQWLYN